MEGKMDIIERLKNDDMFIDAIDDAINEIAQLRRELEKLKGYEEVVHKAFLEGPADIRVVQMAYDIANLKSKVEAEKKRADMNESIANLACDHIQGGQGLWELPALGSSVYEYFKKLAESK